MTGLQDKRILVVEDEYFIASDLERALRRAGAQVVGPVANVAQGLRLAAEPLDAALLDVNLDGTFSFPIADALERAGVPHLFLTGYDSWSIPDRYREHPRLAKPFSIPQVVEAVERLCVEGAGQ